jgi:hypothetical protein
MATYTDNYQLTKPTYAEQADIGVVNSNMNKIDEVMHSSQISLAPAYDSTQTYAEGDVVMYELLMYKCIAPTTGVWDASKWERTTASESGEGGSAELDILGEGNGAVVSFSDGASAELAKCVAEIVPKQAGSGTPSPSNVRAISGYTTIKVDVAGKNLVRTEDVATSNISVTKNINGSVTATGYSNGTTRLPRFGFANLKAGTYILSGISGGSNNTYGLRITDSNNQYILDLYDGEQEFTLLEDTSIYLLGRFSANQTTAFNVTFYPMIRKATDSEGFEPYIGTTYTTSLGQTVYGGQLNVLTGELTIDRAIVDLSTLSWTTISNNRWHTGNQSYIKPVADNLDTANALCDTFEIAPTANIYSDTTLIAIGITTTSDIICQNGNAITPPTGYLVYELATPQTVQLTPQGVNSLLGQNNISADTGDVDIVYVKASAPIQPNPTGTPTATLKKLGIEGTVFEVEGGGGGSSSGINYSTTEQVIGTWIDGKPVYEMTLTGNISATIAIPSLINIIEIKGGVTDNNGLYFVPICWNSGNSRVICHQSNDGELSMTNTTDRTLYRITIRYTKITD